MRFSALLLALSFCGQPQDPPVAAPPGRLAAEYRRDFRDGRDDARGLKPEALAEGNDLIRPRPGGLEVTVPPGADRPAGVSTRFRLRGDFEVTAGYEIPADANPGSGATMDAELHLRPDGEWSNFASMNRSIRPEGEFLSYGRGTNLDGKRGYKGRKVPSRARSGRFRIAREGKMLIYSVAEGDGEFREVFRAESWPGDVERVRLTGSAKMTKEPVRVVWKDLVIRAESLPGWSAGPSQVPPPRSPETSSLDGILAPIRAAHKVPGLVGAIVRDGRVVAIGAAGVRKEGEPGPLRAGDVVHLGSDTKAMTAALLGLLVEDGKIAWSSTLASVFPAEAAAMHPDYRPVTLEQLLTHRAGLPADAPYWRPWIDPAPTGQRLGVLRSVLAKAPASNPGTRFSYSNVGYVLAGLMAETVAGRPWEDLMAERLFRPLGMGSAGFGPPGSEDGLDHPWGHLGRAGGYRPVRADNPWAMGPAGNVHCSLPDWARFIALFLRDGNAPGPLRPDTIRRLATPPPGGDYAMGWEVVRREWAGGQALTHGGSNTMWVAVAWVAPGRGFAVLVATNAGDDAAMKACSEASKALITRAGDLAQP